MALCFLLWVAPGSNCGTSQALSRRSSIHKGILLPTWCLILSGRLSRKDILRLHLKKKKAGIDLVAVKKLQKSRGPTALVLMFLIFDNTTLTGVSACKSEGGSFYRRRWRKSLPKACLGGISWGPPSLCALPFPLFSPRWPSW